MKGCLSLCEPSRMYTASLPVKAGVGSRARREKKEKKDTDIINNGVANTLKMAGR